VPDGDAASLKEKQMLQGLLFSGKRSSIGVPNVSRQRRMFDEA